MKNSRPEKTFLGIGVSAGVVLGQALKLDSHNRVISKMQVDDAEAEVQRALRAIDVSKQQLEALKIRLEQKAGREHGFILDVHLLMLEDQTLLDEIVAGIRKNHSNAEWVLRRATDKILLAYESLEDEYFRERRSDIENVVERILMNLSDTRPTSRDPVAEDVIIVSRDFNPSSFATMDVSKLRGLALESGGRTSHTAIIARGLQVPAVMEVRDFLQSVSTGDNLLLNGYEGEVILNPSQATLERFKEFLGRSRERFEGIPLPTNISKSTKDGTKIALFANTELPDEGKAAKRYGAQGIGLFRSEFLFFAHPTGSPCMQDQLEVYASLAKEMSPYSVAIRTLDAGSDKGFVGVQPAYQLNPSMGLRGIRLSLAARHEFEVQIEAILRAGSAGKLEVVIPMISTVEEIWEAKALIENIRSRIGRSICPPLGPLPVGAMIEVPAAILAIDAIAREVDFLCVGTNDLVQYMLAVDRSNPQVSYLFQPLHPSILRSLVLVARAAREAGKPVRICGEISSNPYFAVLLLGLGFTNLSMNPASIPTVRAVVQEVSIQSCRALAERLLELTTAREIADHLIESVSKIVDMDLSEYVREVKSPDDHS